MRIAHLTAAWLALLALSAATALLTVIDAAHLDRRAATIAVLVLAGLKARVILASYLGLSGTRFWTRVFDSAIGLFLILASAIYLIGSIPEVGNS